MTVAEIYSQIANHMIQGMMTHEQLANYYDFLCLEGYKRCHEYHYLKETCAYRAICRYFINHHGQLIQVGNVDDPRVIPDSWYRHDRKDVDIATKRNAVKTGLTKWVSWERETKQFYERMYKELMDINEVASACKIKELIADVDHELKCAERYHINKEMIGYDIIAIVGEQKKKHDKYKRKMEKELHVSLC